MEKTPHRRPVSTGPVRKTPTRAPGRESLFSLPEDLTEMVGPEILAAWVEEELSKLNWEHPLLEDILRQHPNYHPKELLAALAYACVSGRHTSGEIARACAEDAACRRLCQGAIPSRLELAGFRKANRDLVATIIQRLLVRALSRKHGRDPLFIPPEIDREMRDRAFARLDIAPDFDSAGD